MDSRFNDESITYTQFLRIGFSPLTDVTVEVMAWMNWSSS